jgi:sirohydrochlorin ferrochelatase
MVQSWENSGSPLGILLVGHGTRDARGIDEFLAVAVNVALSRPKAAVESCFLELAAPSILSGVARLAKRGVRQFVVSPVLLFGAGHAKRGVPEQVAFALASFPEMSSIQAAHLGCHPAILEQSWDRFDEAVRKMPNMPPEETVLIFVGRGSNDDDATREMHYFAKRAPQNSTVSATHVGFLAMARPTLEATLTHVVAGNPRRICVQPHLLFDGLLMAEVQSIVCRWAEACPEIDFQVIECLGPTPKVSRAILERVDEAIASQLAGGTGAQVPAATKLM